MKIDYIEALKSMIAIIPLYKDGEGKITMIKAENGYEYLTKVSINKALRDYFALNLLSLKAVTSKSEKLLDKKSLVPLINNNEVIIPIKTIKPLVKGDRAFGYINYSKVKEVRNGVIIFKDGEELSYIDKYETVKRRIAEGDILVKAWWNLQFMIEKEAVAQ